MKRFTIGENAQIDEGVLLGYMTGRKIDVKDTVIGKNAIIRSNTVIYTNTFIGDGLETGHGVVIREENQIGDKFSIWNNSTVDYGCKIGDNVRIHCNVYIAQYTVIEDDVFIAPGVIIGNDPHPICTKCLKGPTIRKGARIGINATLLPHIEIGEYSLVGAGCVVTKDVPPKSVVYRNPVLVVKPIDDFECQFGFVDKPYLDGKDVRSRESDAKIH
jgi:acetyltransferase-like isoleucine patch superfamily enzyme